MPSRRLARSRLDRAIDEAAPTLSTSIPIRRAVQDAYDEAERLLEINLDQAAHAGRQAARWVSIANVIAVGAAALLIATVGAVIVGARVKVDQPLSALRLTIDRFASEGCDARGRDGTGRDPADSGRSRAPGFSRHHVALAGMNRNC